MKHIPAPPTFPSDTFAALAFDSWYDEFKGVVSLIMVKSGHIKKGDRITSVYNDKHYEVNDVGILHPMQLSRAEGLRSGQVGYITCGMKDPRDGKSGLVMCRKYQK